MVASGIPFSEVRPRVQGREGGGWCGGCVPWRTGTHEQAERPSGVRKESRGGFGSPRCAVQCLGGTEASEGTPELGANCHRRVYCKLERTIKKGLIHHVTSDEPLEQEHSPQAVLGRTSTAPSHRPHGPAAWRHGASRRAPG